MKFFHISDLHIGLKLVNRDLREDQEYILRQIVQAAKWEQPDAVVIAGDLYDKAAPSAEAVEVFGNFITDLTSAVPGAAVMMISGNHDSAPRVDCFRGVLFRQNVYMIGMPPQKEEDTIEKVVLQDAYGKVNFYLLPFVKPSAVKQIVGVDADGNNLSYNDTIHKLLAREHIDPCERNVFVSHQFYLPAGTAADDVERMDSEIRTVGNIDVPKRLQRQSRDLSPGSLFPQLYHKNSFFLSRLADRTRQRRTAVTKSFSARFHRLMNMPERGIIERFQDIGRHLVDIAHRPDFRIHPLRGTILEKRITEGNCCRKKRRILLPYAALS